jgi:apolipoprotein N-acyltransferase
MQRLVLSFFMGILAASTMPHAGWVNLTWNLTPYSFPVFALSLYVLYQQTWTTESKSLRTIFARTYIWAFGYFLFGLNWVGNALLIDGNNFLWAWPFAVLGLPFLLSFFWAVPVTLARRFNIAPTPLAFAATLALAELARGYLFTGFPWNLPGYFWSDTLMVFQVLSLIGPYGLTFLTLWWGVSACTHIKTPRRLVLPTAVFAAVLAFGLVRLNTPAPNSNAPHFNIVMVQPNIPQSEKWDGQKAPEHFETHLRLGINAAKESTHPTAIIWPEAALPPSYVDDDAVRGAINRMLSFYPPGSALLTGAVYTAPPEQEKFYNGIVAYTEHKTQKAYAKFHLVPFGEYIPFQRFIPVGPVAEFDNLTPGPGPETVTVGTLPPFRPLVCYEVIFPAAIYKNRGNAQWILNVTNDAWYGHSPGPYQHLAQARARTIESGLPLVRVAGTGISTTIDPYGRYVASLPYNTQDIKLVTIPLSSSTTPLLYAWIGDIGCGIILIILCFIRRNTHQPTA